MDIRCKLGFYDINYGIPIWYKNWKTPEYSYSGLVEFGKLARRHYNLAIL